MSDAKKTEVEELRDLLEVARLVVSTLDIDQVLEAILKSAMKLTGTSAGSVALYNKDTSELEMHAHKGFSRHFIGHARWKVRKGGLTDKILQSKKPTVINDTTNKRFFTNPIAISEGIKSMVCVPLGVKDEVIGILYVDDFTPRKFNKGELGLLSILSSFAAMSIEHARLHAKTKMMAVTDGLTGLCNRRHFQEQLDKELARARRHGENFSLLMLDLDNFKKLNDRYGHTFGDRVLVKLAEIMTNSMRKSDTPARYGGEEFSVILPKAESAQAAILAERIRKNVKTKSAALMRGKGPLTISIGVASYPQDAISSLELVNKADEALYEAKRRGKDRSVEYRELIVRRSVD